MKGEFIEDVERMQVHTVSGKLRKERRVPSFSRSGDLTEDGGPVHESSQAPRS